MTLDEKILATLEEIRDAQKELLSIHRANAAALKQSHELQESSVALQRQAYETQQRAVEQQSVAVSNQLSSSRLQKVALVVVFGLIAFVLFNVFSAWLRARGLN